VHRTGSTASKLTVTYSLAGAAANGVDYEALSGIVTIPQGCDSTTVIVNPIDDANVEGDESILLTIAPNAGYAVGSQDSATLVIADSEPPIVTATASNPSASEGGPNSGTCTISRTGNTSSALTVMYTVAGTAANGTDYATLPGSVTIPSASASATISIDPIDDADFEGDESVVVTIAPGAGYVVGSQDSATVVIADNDLPVVTVVASNTNVSEGGPNSGTITISRTGNATPALTVTYALAGTASNGADYAALPGSVTIPSASASATISIDPIDDADFDADFEGDESVVVEIAPGAGYVVGSQDSATVIIADNDLPVVTVVASNTNVSEGGANSGTITISRTGNTSSALTVTYALAGTASNGADYATLPGSVTIPSASASATVAVAPIDDADFEGDESVVLAVASAPAYIIGSSSNATVTIVDNDPPTNVTNLPSSVLNLTNWKLTLPVDTPRAGSPDEIRQPELAGFADTNYFRVNSARDGVVFVAHCGGATTSGSTYPRSELREMVGLGSGNASWSTLFGTHTMEITQAITHLPVVKPEVVAGQIHDANDDVIVFRLEGTKLFINEHGTNGPMLTTSYRLGDVFTVKFVARNGGIECYYNGQYIYTYSVSALGCYFKAGCYTQSNTSRGDAPTAYGEVVIYGLSVTHE